MKQWRTGGLLLALTMSFVSCGGGGGTATGGGHADHAHQPAAETPAFGESAADSEADRTVRVQALDSLKFDPAAVTVEAGEVIRFEITNDGRLDHEFVLGTTDYHESAAAKMNAGEHTHDTGVFLPPGGTETLVWRFTEPGEVVFACHVDGHYAAGMAGSLTVEAS